MYVHNGPRGCSYNVSYKAMCKFLDDNDLLCVIRAHQVQSAGCKMYKKHEKTLFPTLVTLFSAPNYCINDLTRFLQDSPFFFLFR